MAKLLSQLKPQPLWDIFEDICSVPHPSKHEEKLIAWLLEFAKKHGIECRREKCGNVIMRKPATRGMERCRGIILQSHLDMVPQKNNDTKHDFAKDPIKPRIDGNFVKATGTTLGADNGIGVAASLAVMAAKDIAHGPLECLLTVDEESGMTGAVNLQPESLSGSILINLDMEHHGELCIGCAGGMHADGRIRYELKSAGRGFKAYTVSVKGLKGGHSGVDIHLGRGNAIKILSRVLRIASAKFGLKLAHISGGNLYNAIPREAFATVLVPETKSNAFEKTVREFSATVLNELKTVDPGVTVTAGSASRPKGVLSPAVQKRLLRLLHACHQGVYRMCADIPNLVETSSNLAAVIMERGLITIRTSQRSSVESQKEDMAATVASVLELAGAKVEFGSSYPGWKPDMESGILKIARTTYRQLFGSDPGVSAVHAGLECGLFKKVYPHWDMVSFGPTIQWPHSPDELVDIESVVLFWRFLKEILRNAPAVK
ncbi:MAG: aminoacyl-histidine dipeptidase [Candidatus Wallbacteria bacterium]|nr:aminoacyl-histidine dipeptidase [Candidatus Wallbacteria bacterium]